MCLCTFNILKKSPDSLKEHSVDLISYCIFNIEESLKKPSIGNKTFLKYTEAVFRLLSTVLEGFKGKGAFLNDIAVKGFVYIIKYLFIGTVFQDKILKTLMIQHSGVDALPHRLVEEIKGDTEEGKGEECSNYSDSDSNAGSTYTDSLSQDILMKAKTSACSCLKNIVKFGHKALFNYRY